MAYTLDQAEHLSQEQQEVTTELQTLVEQCTVAGQAVSDRRIQEHLLYGAGRRISVLKRSVENLFAIFPPSMTRPLRPDALADAQLNLHAFAVNVGGLFENWAWTYVLQHGLATRLERQDVDLFNPELQNHLPAALRQFLTEERVTAWQSAHLKTYADGLMARIPLYLPHAEFTPVENRRYKKLEAEKAACIKAMQWNQLDFIYEKQAAIGAPCFVFLQAIDGKSAPRPTPLHPQLIQDGRLAIECSTLFLRHWLDTPSSV